MQPNLVEVVDLPPELQRVLWEEVAAAAAAVRQLPGVQKLNIAAIGAFMHRQSSFECTHEPAVYTRWSSCIAGNICSQLHVHVTGRYPGDAAWPGPVSAVGAGATAHHIREARSVFQSETARQHFHFSAMQCYGVGTAEPYKAEQLQQLVSKLKSAIQQQRGSSSKFNQRRD